MAIGITFGDPAILEQALTHRSYLNENPGLGLPSNERLEFLGDSVIGFVIAQELYTLFPALPEGKLTKLRAALVKQESLARFAKSLNLGEYLHLGKGERRSGGRNRHSILAGAVEALAGAVYLDKGIDAVRQFILTLLGDEPFSSLENLTEDDHKSRLQELVQSRWRITPSYHMVAEHGPDHNKEFTVEVRVGELTLGKGSAKSKQAAEKRAAEASLLQLQRESEEEPPRQGTG
ncbi:MAG: ribonuclease III [Chloroflexota bacterium]